MDTPEKRKQLEALGQEIFELSNVAGRARAAARKDSVETLTETEILALAYLAQEGVQSVGDIQKHIGVLPAQMSRIVRALEDKSGTAYITCSINADDRRRIDVSITDAGKKALESNRKARMASIVKILAILDVPEREEFMRLLRKIRTSFDKPASDK